MVSTISWLDHSEVDQRRVREMLRLFSDKDTVDDLGIGTVRDAISNSLVPGTSVIQTRASASASCAANAAVLRARASLMSRASS